MCFIVFLKLKRIIETVYVYMYPVTKWGDLFSFGSKRQPLSLFITNMKNYSLTSEDGSAGNADQGWCDSHYTRLRADRHPGALPLRGGP